MNIFQRTEHFQIVSGQAPIVVGAPHHGTRPNVDADMGTGPIALALAEKLQARAVIVSDLRRTVDVNKNPAGLPKAVQHHAFRYQNEIFQGFPRLVIEIHGHVSGQYPVEVATGFLLEENAPGDVPFLERLRCLKGNLLTALSGHLGQSYPVGVFPLDRDVKKTATNTFTFQKIRRARNLAGLECYGLHIELSAEMRTSPQARSDAYINALTDALAGAIRAAFEPLPAAGASIPLRTHPDDADALTGVVFEVTESPEKYKLQSVAVLHPDELGALGALDGDALMLSNAGESVRVEVLSSALVKRGQIAVPARLRSQINVILRQKSTLSLPAGHKAPQETVPGLVIARVRPERSPVVWVADAAAQRVRIQGQSATVRVENSLGPRMVEISTGLMDKLSLTLGEVVRLEAVDEG